MERWIPLNKLDALDEKSVEQGWLPVLRFFCYEQSCILTTLP